MSARERILTLRLMEKLKRNPVYAKALEIEVTEVPSSQTEGKKES